MKLPKINPKQTIAVDLETCDPELKTLAPGYISKVGFIAGFAIACKEGSFYIPVGHAQGKNYKLADVTDWLNNILSADTIKVFHNAQYDLGWLKYAGITVSGRLFDTMLASALLDENRRSYTLDNIGKIYLGEGKNEIALETAVKNLFADTKTHKTIISYKEDNVSDYLPLYNAKKRITQLYDIWPDEIKEHYNVHGTVTSQRGQELYKVPVRTNENIKSLLWATDPGEIGSYPVQDVDLTYRLFEKFDTMLAEENLDKVMELENELLPCLLEMREQGVKIDMEKAIELDKRFTKELDDFQYQLDSLAEFSVNIDADTDLVRLCEKLGLEYEHTAKGNPCFNAEKMPKHEAFDYVQKIRKLNKARNTYIRGYYFNSSINGRLHGQYNQLKSDEGGAVTGRLSSSNPNLQNIPARDEILGPMMRSLFMPDTPDEKWLCMDFSGQEPKMLVNLVLMLDKQFGTVKRKNLNTGEIVYEYSEGFPGANLARQEEFSGRTADFHTAVARKCMEAENKHKGIAVTEDELKNQTKKFRSKAKSIGLGIMYGSGNKKVAEEMTKKGEPMTEEEASTLRQSIYDGVPFLDAVNKYVMNIAKTRGYVLTLLKRRGRFNKWEIPIYKTDREKALVVVKKVTGRENLLFDSRLDALNWSRSDEYTRLADSLKEGELGRPQRAFTYKALNKIIQGSSADQTKMAMLKLYKRNDMQIPSLDIYYRKKGIKIPPKIRVQVHDELNFSIDENEDVSWYQTMMEQSLPLLVQSVAEPGVGSNWSEAKH